MSVGWDFRVAIGWGDFKVVSRYRHLSVVENRQNLIIANVRKGLRGASVRCYIKFMTMHMESTFVIIPEERRCISSH